MRKVSRFNDVDSIADGSYGVNLNHIPEDILQWKRGKAGGDRIGRSMGERPSTDNLLLERIERNTDVIARTRMLTRGLLGRAVTVGTTPTLLVRADSPRAYTFMNPALVVGTTTAGTLLASASRIANGDTTADSLGVANFGRLHLYLDVTAVTGTTPTLEIISQSVDPASLAWTDTQSVWSDISATGTYYASIGDMGLTTDFAVRWVLGGTSPDFTFSIGYVLKDGLMGTGSGLSKAIYIGGNAGLTTTAGYPILEGASETFFLNEGIEIYGVANASLDMRIFEL